MQGDFSFDALFGNLVNELLPSYQEEEGDSLEGHSNIGAHDSLQNGNLRITSDAGRSAQGLSTPLFPEVDALLSLFQDSCRELIDLRKKVCILCNFVQIRSLGLSFCELNVGLFG